MRSAYRSAPAFRRVDQEHRELVTAVARHDREIARVLDEHARHFPEHLIARLVTVPVVDGLEVVEVDEDERHRLAEARVALGLLLDPEREVPAVVGAGQWILEHEIFERCVANGHRRLRGEGVHDALASPIERHDHSAIVAGVDEL
jgi:hypothetical protein